MAGTMVINGGTGIGVPAMTTTIGRAFMVLALASIFTFLTTTTTITITIRKRKWVIKFAKGGLTKGRPFKFLRGERKLPAARGLHKH